MKINYPAVVLAAIVHWILGAVWYGIFSKQFLALITPEKMKELEHQSEAKAFILAFVSSLILAYVLARYLQYTKAAGVLDGLRTAFSLWLGFIVTTQLLIVLFEGRAAGLYLLNIGYQLVACASAGAILTLWKPRQVGV